MALSAAGSIPPDAVVKGLKEARINFVASLVQDDKSKFLLSFLCNRAQNYPDKMKRTREAGCPFPEENS